MRWRLLFVHERFGALAGAEVNLFLTADELRKRGHSLAIAHGAGTGRSEDAWRELFPERFPLGEGDPRSASRAAIETFQPDAVYVHKMADLDVLQTLVQSGRPLIRMVHDHDLYCLRSYKYFPLTRRVCRKAAGWCCVFPCGAVLSRSRNGGFPLAWRSYRAKRKEIDLNRRFHRLIVASDYMRVELLRNRFDPGRLEIHAPVPRSDVEVPQSSLSDRNRIVYAGQIIRGKGVDVLIESLARVRAPFECVVLGDGSHRTYCERLSERFGLGARVNFRGYLAPEAMREFYRDASLAVVSSVWPEPFGAAGLEAMRHGLPVVAFDAGGICEWLRDGVNGFLVPRMDRTQFAARVELLLRDKTLARQLGEQARRFAQEKFSFDKYISGLEELFDRVMSEAHPTAVP